MWGWNSWAVECTTWGVNKRFPTRSTKLLLPLQLEPHIKSKYFELEREKEIHVVGGGIVGVEVAAEVAYFLKSRVRVYDGNPRLLFQLPVAAHEYAKNW